MMCNLYSMTRNTEVISRPFRVPRNRATTIVPLASIFPGYQAPVIRHAAVFLDVEHVGASKVALWLDGKHLDALILLL